MSFFVICGKVFHVSYVYTYTVVLYTISLHLTIIKKKSSNESCAIMFICIYVVRRHMCVWCVHIISFHFIQFMSISHFIWKLSFWIYQFQFIKLHKVVWWYWRYSPIQCDTWLSVFQATYLNWEPKQCESCNNNKY